MSQIVNTLPPLPDMSCENYCLCSSSSGSSHTYTLICFSNLSSNTFDDEGDVYTDYLGGYSAFYCNSGDEEWDYSLNTIGSPAQWRINRENIIASTVDLYNSDGTIFCPATQNNYFKDNISVISYSITPSTISSALNDTRILLPILIVALIAVIGFRKACKLLKGAIKGV